VEELVRKNFNGCFKEICLTDYNTSRGHAIPKYEYCKKLGIELMIEDIPSSAIEISKECNISVIMPDCYWNKKVDLKGTKVIRAFDGWKGIMEETEKILYS